MTFTITHYGVEHSIRYERDDLSLHEAAFVLRNLLLSVGYHPESVEELLPEDSLEVPK